MQGVWSDLHKHYKEEDWIDKPSIFAETAIQYFPKSGKVLDLGAGQGQDSRFFAEHGYNVTSTDIEDSALELAKSKLTDELKPRVTLQKVDLSQILPYEDKTYDVVYAHLSLHYFDSETTKRLFYEIQRVLKPGGVVAFLVNSVNDPEYKTGEEIETNFFKIEKATKRYFSIETTRDYIRFMETNLIDNLGETYKDAAKGIHNLIRYIGKRPLTPSFQSAVPFVAGIIERDNKGVKEVLIQTRWQPQGDPLYTGTFEFPAGTLDQPFENIYDALAREINEETGLTLKQVLNDSQTKTHSPKGNDGSFGFRPFCCVQQLKNGKPWVGYVFICEVENGEPRAQLSETKDVKWVPVEEIKSIYNNSPEKLFTLELPAWEYYFKEAH